MIKFGIRHNLIYALMFVIFNFLRKADSIIMKNYIEYHGSLILTLIMFIADFISGLLVYLYNLKYLKEKEASKFMGIELIQASSNITPPDNNFKMYALLFLASFVDFIEYVLSSFYIPGRFNDVSISMEWRLKTIIICFSALLCYFSLKFPIFKHQIITIIIILICLLIVIITELLVFTQIDSHSLSYILKVIFLMIIDHMFNSGLDVIEKYLLEYDYMNPYLILMMEGLFGFLLSLLLLFFINPFQRIIDIHNDVSSKKFTCLIICIILYFFFSCGRNIYRVTTNKLYSPTHKALFDYILVPILIIYYYAWDDDFQVKGKKVFSFFFINLIVSLVMVFCGLIYNELFIIFFCGLEYDTHYEVSRRAKIIESQEYEMSGNSSGLSSFAMDNNKEE